MRQRPVRRNGFTLAEVVVSLAILAMVMIGFLSLFDTSSKIAKTQGAISDVQENLRYLMEQVIRTARQAGAGGLPAVAEDNAGIDTGATDLNSGGYELVAAWVEDNVSGHAPIGGRTPIDGTDVLWIRGCLSGEIYDMDASGYSATTDGSGNVTGGTFSVLPASISGQAQDTTPLENLIDPDADPPKWVPVVLTTAQADYEDLNSGHKRTLAHYGVAIVTSFTKSGTVATFNFTTTSGSAAQDVFIGLNQYDAFKIPNGAEVSRVAAINEVEYFVANDDDGVPTLYSNTPPSSVAQPVASDVVDLQAALGCDTNVDGTIQEDTSDPPVAGSGEWLFHASGETLGDLTPAGVPKVAYLTQMRITLVARIPVADLNLVPDPANDPRRTFDPAHDASKIFNEDGRNLLAESYKGISGHDFRYRSLTERIKLRSLGPIL
jgi:prepilin-type N-terminal cleavage/methylation domain-containing protein